MVDLKVRKITNDELGILVKLMRDSKSWTQEQLAEISHLNTRTIQRVENGQSASFDTRRALALAFDADDIDCFNKEHSFPTQKEIQDAINRAQNEYLRLDAFEVKNGRLIGELAEWSKCDIGTCDFELPLNVQLAYAELLDGFREFRECVEIYNEVDKVRFYEDLNQLLTVIEDNGFRVKYAKRATALKANKIDERDLQLDIVYFGIFPMDQKPSQFFVAKKINFNF